MRRTLVLSTLLLGVAAPSWASFSGGGSSSSSPPPQTSAPPSATSDGSPTTRQEAADTYGLGYEEVSKAEKDLAAGKAKNAEKKFKRALERGERAVELDSTYHEAWNLVGYCARKLGDYDKAFAAYGRCLALKPDYAPAIEYLGEAWLEKGDASKAREQLAALEKLGAAEAKQLREQIEKYVAAHPGSPAPADTAASTSSGGH